MLNSKLITKSTSALMLMSLTAGAATALSAQVRTQSVSADSKKTQSKDDSKSTQSRIDETQTKIDHLQDQVKASQAKMSELQSQQTKAAQKQQKLQRRIDARKKQLKKQAQAIQKNGGEKSVIETIADSDSISDAIAKTQGVRKLSAANTALINAQERDQQNLKKQTERLQKMADEQKSQTESLNKQVAQLAVQKTQLNAKKHSEDKAAQEAAKKAQEAAQRVAAAKSADDATQAASQAQEAMDSVSGGSASTGNANPSGSIDASSVVSYAISLTKLGIPYVWGGTSLSGFDCSGLTQYVYAKFGKSLPRTAAAQSLATQPVSMNNLKPGDLLFWGGRGSAYHVAIYIGGDNFVAAPAPGQNVSIGNMKWFTPDCAGRL